MKNFIPAAVEPATLVEIVATVEATPEVEAAEELATAMKTLADIEKIDTTIALQMFYTLGGFALQHTAGADNFEAMNDHTLTFTVAPQLLHRKPINLVSVELEGALFNLHFWNKCDNGETKLVQAHWGLANDGLKAMFTVSTGWATEMEAKVKAAKVVKERKAPKAAPVEAKPVPVATMAGLFDESTPYEPAERFAEDMFPSYV